MLLARAPDAPGISIQRWRTAATWGYIALFVGSARTWTAAILLAAPLSGAASQALPRAGYIEHLPTAPRIVAQTAASVQFQLYGDTGAAGYVDRAPVDGIDDHRGERLLALAEHFSPILRRNTFLVPRDVWWVLGRRPVLEVDRWRDHSLVSTDSIPIASVTAEPTDDAAPSRVDEADRALQQLVGEFDPYRAHAAIVEAGPRESVILFFDTPGNDQQSWRAAYKGRGYADSRIYAHFLVVAAPPGHGDRYAFAIQFWFFYPFNDGPNNHEGDWEHINVHITTRASVDSARHGQRNGGFLTRSEVTAILDGETRLDDLLIRAVDYYFHHHVTTLDYFPVLLAGSRASPDRPDTSSHVMVDDDYIAKVVRQRLRAYGGMLSTHPVGYIGGNNKGPDELYHIIPRSVWSYNRNSGATYPLPGTWQTVGPLGATETVRGDVVPPLHELGDRYLTYPKAAIHLLPDWERLASLVREDPVARRRWAWFILPVRWGYPASVSPAAGAIPNVDLGNLAPLGPAFSSMWNHLGANSSYEAYVPKTLRTPISPIVPWAVVQSGWGLFNYPLVLTQLYPFYNMMSGHLSPWVLPIVEAAGGELPKTHVSRLPTRFATIGVGVSVLHGGGRLGYALLQATENAQEASGAPGARSRVEQPMHSTTIAPRVWLDLHFGNSFYFENSYSATRSNIGYSQWNATRDSALTMRGVSSAHHLTGGIRKILPSLGLRGPFDTFARAGYGWTWYTIRDVTVNDRSVEGSAKGGYRPPFLPGRLSWPNLAYSGLTFEYFRAGSAKRLRYMGHGIRIDAGGFLQRVTAAEAARRSDMWVMQGELGIALTQGW